MTLGQLPATHTENKMKAYILLLALGLVACWSTVAKADPCGVTISDSIDVLNDLADAPDKRVPPALLRDASAVIIAPDIVKAGFIVGARHGHGVMLIRQKDGWSDPIFVTMTGGSVGWQAGIESTDLFLIIRNAKSLDRIIRGAGKLTLGGEASVAAGPIGREMSAATDAQLKAEILSYSRSRGLFAGIALDGDTIQVDNPSNDKFYGQRRVKVSDIVAGKMDLPKDAATLKARLTHWTGEARPAPPPADSPKK
jgi:lipid-binding SYLF domain-containing protein